MQSEGERYMNLQKKQQQGPKVTAAPQEAQLIRISSRLCKEHTPVSPPDMQGLGGTAHPHPGHQQDQLLNLQAHCKLEHLVHK